MHAAFAQRDPLTSPPQLPPPEEVSHVEGQAEEEAEENEERLPELLVVQAIDDTPIQQGFQKFHHNCRGCSKDFRCVPDIPQKMGDPVPSPLQH